MIWAWELLISSPVCAVVLKARDTKQGSGCQHFSLIYWNHFSCCSAFICMLNSQFGTSAEGITSTSEESGITWMCRREQMGRVCLGCAAMIFLLSNKAFQMYWFMTELQLRTAFSGTAQLKCDSKRKHDMLLALWGFLEMRNAQQETLHTCTNPCTTAFWFTTSCQHLSANKLTVPFLWSLRKSPAEAEAADFAARIQNKAVYKRTCNWFYISSKYKRT